MEAINRELYIALSEFLRRYELKVQNSLKTEAVKYNRQLAPLLNYYPLWLCLEEYGQLLSLDYYKQQANIQINGKQALNRVEKTT
jgi:hypothetical protein